MNEVNPNAVVAEHDGNHLCSGQRHFGPEPCLPYRLADALRLSRSDLAISEQHVYASEVECDRLTDALAAERATLTRLRATWEPYDEDDEGQVPWRLQRDMRAAFAHQSE